MKTLFRFLTGIALFLGAVACNQEELDALLSSSSEQATKIASIKEQVDNINATLVELRAADAALNQAIAALQDEDIAIRAQLEADKARIEASIDSLGNYVNLKLQEMKDWAEATFATLAQYNDLCDSLATVKQSLAELDARITAQLKHSIDSLETSMKAWVNEQLAGYYTIAEMDAKLAALEAAVQDGDKANADAIAQLQADLVQQASDLTTAYQAAIAAAIEENNGGMNEKIATEIATVNTRITNEIKIVSDRIDELELRMQAVEDYINSQKAFTISFTMPNDTVCFPGETVIIGYTVSHSTLPTQIECIPDEGWKAVVTSEGDSGTIAITAPADGGKGKVIVLANRSCWTLMSTISLEEGILRIAKDEYPAPAEGGRLDIPFVINANYGIKVAEADVSWITVVPETKAALRDETLSLSITANPNQSIRVGKVYIYPENGSNDEYYELTINQASAVFSVSTTGFVVGGDVTSKELTVTSSLPFKLDLPGEADWLNAESELLEGTTYKVTVSFMANNGENRRATDLSFLSTDGSTRYGSVAIIQDTRSEEDISAMIFEVRANIANDYTVYLPISNAGRRRNNYLNGFNVDCYVDWGDGITEHIVYNEAFKTVSHHYQGLSIATTYHVKVSGLVQSLSWKRIDGGLVDTPISMRSTIIAVLQWGKTGLLSMWESFYGCSSLIEIAGDEYMSFSNVLTFEYAFSRCVKLDNIPTSLFKYASETISLEKVFSESSSLTSIPEKLFSSCVKCRNFNGAFQGCTGLTSIPDDLFTGNTEAESFSSSFASCKSLLAIPESLFSNCEKVVSFDYAFSECYSLTSLPESLFLHNSNAQSFSHTFYDCHNLEGIPVSLFDNNRKITNLFGCFFSVKSQGESPYTIIDGVKYHLYERKNNPDEFATPVSYSHCFYDTKWSDYESIPNDWK